MNSLKISLGIFQIKSSSTFVLFYIRSAEPPLYMRVIYDFMARNIQELSVMKGDNVQVIFCVNNPPEVIVQFLHKSLIQSKVKFFGNIYSKIPVVKLMH